MITFPFSTGETAPSIWSQVGQFFVDAGWKTLTILCIIVGAIILSWILRIIIKRVVNRIVNGAKNKANVDDTQALERSPLASVRVVQRTRTLGSILRNVVNVTLVIVSMLLIVNVLAPNALASLTLLTAAIGAGLGFGLPGCISRPLS